MGELIRKYLANEGIALAWWGLGGRHRDSLREGREGGESGASHIDNRVWGALLCAGRWMGLCQAGTEGGGGPLTEAAASLLLTTCYSMSVSQSTEPEPDIGVRLPSGLEGQREAGGKDWGCSPAAPGAEG